MTTYQIIAICILSGFASLDRLAGLNIMLSRPFVVSGIIGYIFGNIEICLFIGILFEFFGMLEVPVGTTIALDDTFGGYASSLLVAIGVASNDAVSLLFCICVTVIIMYPVTLTDKYCRKFNGKLIEYSVKNNKKDYESSLITYGVIISFLRGILVYNLGALVIYFFLYLIDKINNTFYPSNLSIILLAVFMLGYLVRFFSVKFIYKFCFLVGGIFFGWFIL